MIMTYSKLCDSCQAINMLIEEESKNQTKKLRIYCKNLIYCISIIFALLLIFFLINYQYHSTNSAPLITTPRINNSINQENIVHHKKNTEHSHKLHQSEHPKSAGDLWSQGSLELSTHKPHKQNKQHKHKSYVNVDNDNIYVKNWNGSINVDPNDDGSLPNKISFKNIDGDVHIG